MNCDGLKLIVSMVAVLLLPILSTKAWAAQVLFTPEVTLSEQYSDNIFLSHENEEEDFITAAGVNLTLEVLGRKAGLNINYNPSYNAFADNSDLDYWRHAGNLTLWNDLSPNIRAQWTNDYLETEDPTDQTADFAPEDPLEGPAITGDIYRTGRNRYRTGVSEARLTHQFGRRDNYFAALQYRFLEEIDTLPGESVDDNKIWQPLFGMEYWFTQRWGASADGYYSNRHYTDEDDRQEYTGFVRLLHAYSPRLDGFLQYRHTHLDYDQEVPVSDYTIYEPSIGMTYQFEQAANITIGAGYYIQDFDNSDENEDGWILSSQIYKRWNFRSSYIELRGESGQEINDTGTQDLGLDIYYLGRIDAGYDFTPRFSGLVYAGYRDDKFPNEEPERTSNAATAGVSATYQTLQWMYLTLSYDYRDLQSDIQTDEYTENRVTLLLTLRPVTPYRLN